MYWLVSFMGSYFVAVGLFGDSISVVGVVVGPTQGYYGGWVDLLGGSRFVGSLVCYRALNNWLFLSSFIEPNFLVVTRNYGAVQLDEFSRHRAGRSSYVVETLIVRAAQAMGVDDKRIMLRHMLPNAMVASLTMMPFILSSSVTTLTSLDFLGFGLPAEFAFMSELLAGNKANLQRLGLVSLLSSYFLWCLRYLSSLVKRYVMPSTHISK